MSDADVMGVLALVMAETLAAGTGLIDTIGVTLKVDIGQDWQPDDTIFSLIKDREAASAMPTDVIGPKSAKSCLTETGAKQKAIIREALAGDGRGPPLWENASASARAAC